MADSASIILIVSNFILTYYGQTIGIMWFVMVIVGEAGVGVTAMLINQSSLLQYSRRFLLITLCIHGSVYRIVVKIVSVPLHMSTDIVRESILLALIVAAITLVTCSVAYRAIARITPWMIGKIKKVVVNSGKRNASII